MHASPPSLRRSRFTAAPAALALSRASFNRANALPSVVLIHRVVRAGELRCAEVAS